MQFSHTFPYFGSNDADQHFVQGDGTAVCLQDTPAAFTFSMHGATNFPARKQTSDLDVPLPDGMEDQEYLRSIQFSAY